MDIALPSDLEAWLDQRSSELGIERETLLVQLIDTHRTSSNVNDTPSLFEESDTAEASSPFEESAGGDDGSADDFLRPETRIDIMESVLERKIEETFGDEFEAALDRRIEAHIDEALDEEFEAAIDDEFQDALTEQIDRRIGAALSERLDDHLEEALAELEAQLEEVAAQLEGDLESLEGDHRKNVRDLRERVIQVKKEADRKAPLESHQALAERVTEVHDAVEQLETEVTELSSELADIDDQVSTLATDLSDLEDEQVRTLEESVTGLESDLGEARERLQSLAWVVKELREDTTDELDQLKRKAAQLGVSTAVCENCDSGVELALLTEPACPHCSASITNVRDADGIVGKPRLLTDSSSPPSPE